MFILFGHLPVLKLSAVSVASVSEEVSITVLVLSPGENLHCKLNTGDGQIFYFNG